MRPIIIGDLLLALDRELVLLLKGLQLKDWQAPTLAGQWTVKDIVAHLLDGSMRTLSMLRDGYFGDDQPQFNSYAELVQHLNQLNADWIKAAQRLSPALLIELTEHHSKAYGEYLISLPAQEPAVFSVAWAGEGESPNWFHVAREYTERWHHQQQIRFALGQDEGSPLLAPAYYTPYLDTSLRALPHHYRDMEAAPSTCVQFSVNTIDQNWFLLCQEDKSWQLVPAYEQEPDCHVSIPANIAWRVFTKGISQEQALERSSISGQSSLGRPIFDLIAVMA